MPLLLRKVSHSRWKLPGDPSSDALRCLLTDRGDLSLWSVLDDQANLDDIVTALASNCEHLCKIDYFMIPQDQIEQLGIRLEAVGGATPALRANRWHIDAKDLTARTLAAIAHAMYVSGTHGRKSANQIKALLANALAANALERNSMKPSLLAELQ